MTVAQTEADARARKGAKLRRLRFEDYPQIKALESRFGLNPRNENEWRHLWLENPAFRDLKGDWNIGWVLEGGDGRIVASLGSVPIWYELEGRRILAWTGKGLVGEPGYRSGCLFLLDQLINKTPGDLYLNNTIGTPVASAFDVFDCPRVPVGAWDRTALWIASHKGLAESLLVSSRFRRAASCLRFPLAAGLLLCDRLKSRALPCGHVDVRSCQTFDDRFDDFWEKLRKNQPNVLLGLRTRETLAWHFKLAAVENRLWIAVVGDETPAAYAIFERKDGGHGSALKRVRLVDFQSLDGSTALLPAFLDWAIRRCRQESIHFLETTGHWVEKGDLLDTLAPYHRALPTWTYFYSAKTPELIERLKQPGTWAPTLFDGEATLW